MNLDNSKESFIAKYKAAVKAKLTREQFSQVLNIKPDSLIRRRLAIFKETGLNLPMLISDEESELTQEAINRYNSFINPKSDNIPSTLKLNKNKNIFVITSAQNATPIHEDFFSTLLNYCEHRNAQLIIIPNRYKNPTSIWTSNDKCDDWWHSKLVPYLCSEDLRLCKSLRVMGHIKIQPTAEKPLSGFDSYTGVDSAIFGHAKVQLKTVATPSKMLPKLLTTTGSVTISNYTDSKAGWKSDFHHSISAVVVEIDSDGDFHLRHIHADEVTGHFYDLDKYYTKNEVLHSPRVRALITGDTHAEFIDQNVLNATYLNHDSIAAVLNPENMVFHDITDFFARNHHEMLNDIGNVGKHRYGRNNVEEGLQKAADFIDLVSRKNTLNVIVKSNHDEAFDRWLRTAEPKDDPENAQFYHYMKWNQYKNVKMNETGFESIDPFEFWCKNPEKQRGLKNIENTKFLCRGESFVIDNIELGFHGDLGINGANGSAASFAKISQKNIIGHGHYPEIFEGCYRVGVSARLDLSYQKGQCSNWLHTHAVIYPDGKRTLINVINGKWRL
jgi:hypothetical protein